MRNRNLGGRQAPKKETREFLVCINPDGKMIANKFSSLLPHYPVSADDKRQFSYKELPEQLHWLQQALSGKLGISNIVTERMQPDGYIQSVYLTIIHLSGDAAKTFSPTPEARYEFKAPEECFAAIDEKQSPAFSQSIKNYLATCGLDAHEEASEEHSSQWRNSQRPRNNRGGNSQGI